MAYDRMFQVIVLGGIGLVGAACTSTVVKEQSSAGVGGAGGFPEEGTASSSSGMGGFPQEGPVMSGAGGFPQETGMMIDSGPPDAYVDAGLDAFPQEGPAQDAGFPDETDSAHDAGFPQEA